MANPIIREHNQATGEIIDRQMTNAEVAESEAAAAARAAQVAAEEAEKQTILDRLGVTAEQLKALLQ